MSAPSDPVIQFICDAGVSRLVMLNSTGPYSRLSRSRLNKIGYKLLVLRCAQLGIEPPTRSEASAWVSVPVAVDPQRKD